uniref:Uncharacterized protein n=1 Tax=Setaria digitata TaxID=48799 RepID=A0A915PVR2_9BILA
MNRRATVIMSVMSCYAGGIFLATCFLDTLPHLKKELEMVKLSRGEEMKIEHEAEALRVFQALETKDAERNGEIINSDIESINERTRSSNVLASGIVHSITFTIAMSFHSILEGIALGVQDEKFGIITLFISLLLHKGIEAFSVGLQISRTIAQKVKMVIATITIYSLMTPIGSFTGILLQNIDMNESWRQGIILVLEGLAIGTFIFMTFMEVLFEQRNDSKAVREEIIAITLGVLTISGFQYFEGNFRGADQNVTQISAE